MAEQLERRIPDVLPLMAVRELTIFPYMIRPLLVGREKSIKALENAVVHDRLILIATQKQADIDSPQPDDLYFTGTMCEVLQIFRGHDGTARVLIEGLQRAKIINFIQTEPFFEAKFERIYEPEEKDVEVEALMRSIVEQFSEVVNLSHRLPPEIIQTVSTIHESNRLADLVSSYLTSLSVDEQQKLLETISPKERLRKLSVLLRRELEVLQVEQKIESRVKEELTSTQKEFILRERLKAIQQELGERDERTIEIEEFKAKIKEAQMPEEVEKKALKEVERLEKMPPAAAEAVVIRTYLDWMTALPWNKSTEEKLDIEEAAKVLEEDHYGLRKVKERVLEFLAVRKLKESTKGPILCFIGPPGTGKTSIGRSIARALGRKFIRISLGGVRDEAEIRGHRRTYVGALPGRIIQALRNAGSKNPVFMLDEIDKVGIDFRGDPSAALLEVLDPEQNFAFSDHYLEVSFDLSNVMFITTGNFLDPVAPALKDRMEVIEFPGYIEDEKYKIAELFLIPKQIKEHGFNPEILKFSESAVRQIIREYTREAGVRNLEREIAGICRKVATEIARGKTSSTRVSVQNLHNFLGPSRFRYGVAEKEDEIGVVTGLVWTVVGGDVISVEVTLMPGEGKLLLTGRLGDVMKESGEAALSYTRSKAKKLGIDEGFYQKTDVHIHVPVAVPKEGPSAGITMATALISALTKRPVSKDVAMTGEITLRGKVLPVGMVKEKVLAAHRAGIKIVILPMENQKDLEEVPSYVKRDLKFHFVEHMDEVLNIALLDSKKA